MFRCLPISAVAADQDVSRSSQLAHNDRALELAPGLSHVVRAAPEA
jgi:hypothetical protein